MTITLISVVVLVAALVLYPAAVATWRALHDDGRLRMNEIMRLRGARLPDLRPHAAAYGAALAVRRCVTCGAKAQCDAFLASGRSAGYETFCPNYAYIGAAPAAGSAAD